ncbi:MAG: S4 domain-containing protein [Candidatus Eremiobacteraeota bacterium]|nr:S4 domain-containing protein [Candidatus Eremiobacteraeota bacterium]
MRLDKFLKTSALAKRRSVAKQALDAGRIECAGRLLKPSYQVKPGDELLIHYATRDLLVRVDAIPPRPGAKTRREQLITVLSDVRTSGS